MTINYPHKECPDCEHWNERNLACGADWVEIALAPCAGVESLFGADEEDEESEGDETAGGLANSYT